MNVEEFKEKAYLELYAIGLLDDDDKMFVESYMKEHPELKRDYESIQRALLQLGYSESIPLSKEEKEKIFDHVNNNGLQTTTAPANTDKSWRYLSIALGVLSLIGLWQFMKSNNEATKLKKEMIVVKASCDSIENQSKIMEQQFQAIASADNKAIFFTATKDFAETKMVLHFNPKSNTNLIQIFSAPQLAGDEAFQLWSLQEGKNPIPMNVFKPIIGKPITLDFVDGTATYAITIEKEIGAKVPNLNKLIGTAGV